MRNRMARMVEPPLVVRGRLVRRAARQVRRPQRLAQLAKLARGGVEAGREASDDERVEVGDHAILVGAPHLEVNDGVGEMFLHSGDLAWLPPTCRGRRTRGSMVGSRRTR